MLGPHSLGEKGTIGYFWELLITPIVCKPLRSLGKKKYISFSFPSFPISYLMGAEAESNLGTYQLQQVSLNPLQPPPTCSPQDFFLKCKSTGRMKGGQVPEWQGLPSPNATESPEDSRNGGRAGGPGKTECSAPPRSWDPPRGSWWLSLSLSLSLPILSKPHRTISISMAITWTKGPSPVFLNVLSPRYFSNLRKPSGLCGQKWLGLYYPPPLRKVEIELHLSLSPLAPAANWEMRNFLYVSFAK